MKAVIMAGGEGTRLRPMTCNMPKPMVSILNKPVMEHIINLLVSYNIKDIAITLCYLPEMIKDYFEDGKRLNAKLHYFTEETPLGTGGSVMNAGDFLDDTFVVISGDALTDINLKNAVEFHKSKHSCATLVLKKEPIPLEYGIVITDEDGKILRFLEKPGWGEVFSDNVNTGIYILEPYIFKYYKCGDAFDFSRDLFPKLLKDNLPMYGYVTDSYWSDIGDISSYIQSNFDAMNGKVNLAGHDITSHETSIQSGAKIIEPVYIGSNCTIKSGSIVGPYAVIDDNSTILEGASIKRSIISKNVTIGRGSEIRGCILCNKVNLKDNVNIFEGCVIGENTIVSNSSTIKPGIKVWPEKFISPDTILTRNLVWGSRASKKFFGERGISGDINIDITPEFASLLGSAFACTVKSQNPVLISSDGKNPSLIIKNSIVSGILSSGRNAIDCDSKSIPAFRSAVRFFKASGGIRINTGLNNSIHIEVIDSNGCNIERALEKKIENILSREDFERCNTLSTGSLTEVKNYDEIYIQNNIGEIKNIKAIQNKSPKIFVASSCAGVLDIASKFLTRIGCDVFTKLLEPNDEHDSDIHDRISESIVKGNIFMGVIISDNAENIILFDEKGSKVQSDRYNVLSSIILLKLGAKKILLPYTTTRIVDKIAERYNACITRTKSSVSNFMREILSLNGSELSHIQYIFNFDAILSSAFVIDYLIQNSLSASSLFAEIPEFYIKKNSLTCNFNDMGRIIREIVQNNKGSDIELFEGVKVNTQKGWFLVLPDNEKPVFNIYAEGFTEEYADEISVDAAHKIKEMILNNNS